jgi:hypothetical protein
MLVTPPRPVARPWSRSKRKSSPYIGVSWHTQSRRWEAYLPAIDGVVYSVGRFADEEDAARARDLAVLDEFGPDGPHNLNLPDSVAVWQAARSAPLA